MDVPSTFYGPIKVDFMTTDSAHHHEELNFWQKYIFSVDHKIVTVISFTGWSWPLLEDILLTPSVSASFQIQEVLGLVTSVKYNSLVTNHGTIMILGSMPV